MAPRVIRWTSNAKAKPFAARPPMSLYIRGAEELDYQLQHNPVTVKGERRISNSSFDAVKVVLEEAAGTRPWPWRKA